MNQVRTKLVLLEARVGDEIRTRLDEKARFIDTHTIWAFLLMIQLLHNPWSQDTVFIREPLGGGSIDKA